MIRLPACWLVAALASAVPSATVQADAPPTAVVRVGTHQGYSRIAFNFSSHTEYALTQEGEHVVIRFPDNAVVGAANAVPRDVVSITGGVGKAEIVLAAGAAVRHWRAGNLVVIDIAPTETSAEKPAAGQAGAVLQAKPAQSPASLSPGPPTTASPEVAAKATGPSAQPLQDVASGSSGASSKPVAEAVSDAKGSLAKPSQDSTISTPGASVTVPPPRAKSEATGVAHGDTSPPPVPNQATAPDATLAPPPAASPPEAAAPAQATADTEGLLVPAGIQVGVAVLRRGTTGLIVFDQPGAIDLSTVRDDPHFGSATVQTLQTATVIRLPLDASIALTPTRTRDAWRITAAPLEPALRPIQASVADDRLVLRAMQPGAVVSLLDPETGAALLVGTQRQPGQGVPALRRSAEFNLLPTWQGVAIEPNADTIALRPGPQGFIVSGATAISPPSDIAEQLSHSVGLARLFDFPNQSVSALLQLLARQVSDNAAAPPLARGARRQAAARTMIALGMGAEASAMLALAAADDPHLADAPDNAALGAIAALLAHRAEDAAGIADPRLPASDDVALWRAMRQAELSQDPAPAAAIFATTMPLVLAYPAPLRDQLLPLIAETLVAGGETAAAMALLDACKDDAALDLARAMLQESKGDVPGALAAYDLLARSRDQSVHARAAVRAAELRLATGAIDAKQAADRLEPLLYAWRGDSQERALRSRLAALKASSGVWRAAFALLRDGETLFPEDKAAIHRELTDLFASLLRDGAADALPPLELVAAVEENADLLPGGADGEALQAKLADRLVALELPKRAAPVLEKLMKAASGGARAGFGARLAALRLREGDAGGAMVALEASIASDLPASVTERRALLAAAADERRGDVPHALATLGALDSPAALEARAAILERSNNWPGALQALTDYATKTVPSEGQLDDGQRRTLVRLATAAARAGDDAALASMREQAIPRMGSGPLADLVRLLTAEKVRGTADLRRSGQEAALARDLASQLPPRPTAPQTP
ncbi:MAG TPA: hypothetical protein VFL55_13875 [Acetobacteraceae bacterium]|nr:hypothetical protein [Acetobacteraceae bacterium]